MYKIVNKKVISHLVIRKNYSLELGTVSLTLAFGSSNGDNILSELHMLHKISV